MNYDDFFNYLIATDGLDEFLGYKKEDNDESNEYFDDIIYDENEENANND